MNTMAPTQEQRVREAFSRQAPLFDAIDAAEPMIAWVRDRVREDTLKFLRAGMRLLDINAGTGLDSMFFAEQGMQVTATDHSPGMLDQLRRRQRSRPELGLEVAERSFLELEGLGRERFDHVFSNFGGINCTAQLDRVCAGVDHVLRPGGHFTLVIMPRVSPWELVEMFRGHFALAFRRWNKDGATASVEGLPFQCHYHSAASVLRLLPAWSVRSRMALSLIVPPPHLGPFAARHPRFTAATKRMEDLLCRWPLVRGGGDHVLITLRKPWTMAEADRAFQAEDRQGSVDDRPGLV